MTKNTCEMPSLLEPTRCSALPESKNPPKRDATQPAPPRRSKRRVQRLALESWENEGGWVSPPEPKKPSRQAELEEH